MHGPDAIDRGDDPLIELAWFLKGDWKTRRLTQEQALVEKVTEEVLVEEGVR